MKKIAKMQDALPCAKKSCEDPRTQQLCLRHVITHMLGKAIQSSTLRSNGDNSG